MGLYGAANHFDHRIIRWISTLEGSLPARIVIAILLLTFPMAALADLNESTILQTDSALNLDAGAVVGSGGDILWNGSTLCPQGSAKVRNLGEIGSAASGSRAVPLPSNERPA
jgi:hypothetical protein